MEGGCSDLVQYLGHPPNQALNLYVPTLENMLKSG